MQDKPGGLGLLDYCLKLVTYKGSKLVVDVSDYDYGLLRVIRVLKMPEYLTSVRERHG